MLLNIPGREEIDVTHVILDFNGTIAVDGQLIKGVADKINTLSHLLNFVIVTADTYGTVEKELGDVNCDIVNLSNSVKFNSKLDVLISLGKEQTMCVGNGFNDRIVLKECVLGVAVLQAEGLSTQALIASDFVCNSILDVFACFENTNRIKATLRS